MFLQATTGWKKPRWSPNSPQVPRTRDDPLKNGFFQTPSCGKQPKSCQPNMGISLILDYFNQQKHRFSWFSLIEVKKNGFILFFLHTGIGLVEKWGIRNGDFWLRKWSYDKPSEFKSGSFLDTRWMWRSHSGYSGDAAQEELQKIMDYKDRSLWIHKKLRYGQLKVWIYIYLCHKYVQALSSLPDLILNHIILSFPILSYLPYLSYLAYLAYPAYLAYLSCLSYLELSILPVLSILSIWSI
jgi:hypothetical protein